MVLDFTSRPEHTTRMTRWSRYWLRQKMHAQWSLHQLRGLADLATHAAGCRKDRLFSDACLLLLALLVPRLLNKSYPHFTTNLACTNSLFQVGVQSLTAQRYLQKTKNFDHLAEDSASVSTFPLNPTSPPQSKSVSTSAPSQPTLKKTKQPEEILNYVSLGLVQGSVSTQRVFA